MTTTIEASIEARRAAAEASIEADKANALGVMIYDIRRSIHRIEERLTLIEESLSAMPAVMAAKAPDAEAALHTLNMLSSQAYELVANRFFLAHGHSHDTDEELAAWFAKNPSTASRKAHPLD